MERRQGRWKQWAVREAILWGGFLAAAFGTVGILAVLARHPLLALVAVAAYLAAVVQTARRALRRHAPRPAGAASTPRGGVP